MKHFNQVSTIKLFFTKYILRPLGRFFGDMRALAIWVVLALIVPNIVLSFTEEVSPLSAVVNILLPGGIFCLVMGAWLRTGKSVIASLPFMILAAFQLVLLYLYGGSVIAVDMFLNVVTTNVSEATELLANLLDAMGVVIILYLTPIIWGIWGWIKKKDITRRFRRKLLGCGIALTLAGMIATIGCHFSVRDYQFIHETFPVNAVSNLIEACHRYSETAHHAEISAGFTYRATHTNDSDEPEIYVFVIGETSRGENWQLGGYERPTNPRLSQEDGVVFFRKSISESNTTHKSVPMLISYASAENFDSIAHYKSIITAFREAGFSTSFISNQLPNRSFTEHFGNEADTTVYVASEDATHHPYDEAVFEPVDKLLGDTLRRKQLIVIHTYGSHFRYRDRYPDSFSHFTPDDAIDASLSNRDELINAYDNTILYVDYILSSLIDRLKATGYRAGLVYASDHGEDIFDDKRERFLHASPVPTYWQIHQASLVWLSPKLQGENPGMAEALAENSAKRISPQKSLFPTVMQMAAVSSPYVVDSLSLVSKNYNPAPMVYLNDLNKALPIYRSGLTNEDRLKVSLLIQ